MATIRYGGGGQDDGMGGKSLPKQLFPKDRNVPVEQVAYELTADLTITRGYGVVTVTLTAPFLTAHVQFTDPMPAGAGYGQGYATIETYDEVEVIGIDRDNNQVQVWYNIVSASRTARVRARRQLPPEVYDIDQGAVVR